MDNLNNPVYRKAFFEDTDRIMAEFERNLSFIKSMEGQKEAFENIFRYVHSLKGLSASMGIEDIRIHSESLEASVKKLLNGGILDVTDDTLSEIEDGFRKIGEILKRIKVGTK